MNLKDSIQRYIAVSLNYGRIVGELKPKESNRYTALLLTRYLAQVDEVMTLVDLVCGHHNAAPEAAAKSRHFEF